MTKPSPRRARWRAMRDNVLFYLFVALGAAIGGVAHALVSVAAVDVAGTVFPWGTLFVNVVGSFIIGFYATLTATDGRLFHRARTRQFVMTGLCGGFTTFSVFSLETFRLAAAGSFAMAAVNIGVSVVAWFVSVWLGHTLAAKLNRFGGV